MIDHIVLALGGRVAEEIVLDDISTGASNDIQQATNIARNMVTRYGMSSKLGTVLYGSANSSDEVFLGRQFSTSKDYSEKTAAEIDDEIRAIISDCYTTCKNHLSANIDKLHFVAEFLLKNESMDEEQFRVAMETENPTIEQIENIAEDKKKKSAEENNIAHETNRKAEEEARERARLEAERIAKESRERQERANSGAFSSDDFFSTVWNAPNTSGDDESTTDSTDENPSDSDNSNK